MNVSIDNPLPNLQIGGICKQLVTCKYVTWIKSIFARSLTLGCQSCCRLENSHSHQEDEQGQLPQFQEEEGVEGACLQEGVGEEGVCCHRRPCPSLLQQQFQLTQSSDLPQRACHMIVPCLAGWRTDLVKGKHALGKGKPALLETSQMRSYPDSKQSDHCVAPHTLMSQTLLAETAGTLHLRYGQYIA